MKHTYFLTEIKRDLMRSVVGRKGKLSELYWKISDHSSSGQTIFSFSYREGITLGEGEEIDEVVWCKWHGYG